MSSAQLRSVLNWSGALILVVGLGTGVLMWRNQDRIDRENEAALAANPSAPIPPLDSGNHRRDVEIYYGKVGLLLEEAETWFHGKGLAKTIDALSVIAAAGFFVVAARLPQ
jgi:hypothetical protein